MSEGRKEGRSRPAAAYGCGLPHSSPTTSRGASANVIGPPRKVPEGVFTRYLGSAEPEGHKVRQGGPEEALGQNLGAWSCKGPEQPEKWGLGQKRVSSPKQQSPDQGGNVALGRRP